MSLSDGDQGPAPAWKMGSLDWDPVAMTASPVRPAGKAAALANGRAPNTSCQVEGCGALLLPLRSYYQRQHICEEHFRALTITDGSGRPQRFCQQCTKLEPLDCFDGERRSCRASLERRNLRRAGRRRNSRPSTARRAKPAASPKPSVAWPASPLSGTYGTHTRATSGSGSGTGGSATHVLRTSSLSAATAGSFDGLTGAEQPAKRQRSGAGGTPGAAPVAAAYWLQPLGFHELQADGASASVAGSPPPHAPQHVQACGVQLTGVGPLDALTELDVDELLAMDPDHLAEKLLAGGAAFPAPVSPLHQPSGMASSEQWALPSLSSQQQHTWGLPAAAQQTALLHQQHQALLEQQRQQELMLAQQQQQHGLLHQQCMLHQLQQQELLLAQQRHQGQLLLQQQQQQAAQLAAMQAPAPAPTPGMFDGGLLDDRLPSMGTGGLLGSADDDLEVLLLGGFEPGFEEVRASVKLYGAHPDQLPPQLRAELFSALALPQTAAQAAMRSGCVHLTLGALVSRQEREHLGEAGAAAAVLARLLPLARSLDSGRVFLQTADGSGALLVQPSGGRPALLLSLPVGGAVAPQAPALAPPVATTVSAARGTFRLRCPAALLRGDGGLVLHCRRSGGGHVAVSLARLGAPPPEPPADDASLSGSDEGQDSEEEAEEEEGMHQPEDGQAWVETEAWVPAATPPPASDAATGGADHWQAGWGLYEFEVARGALLSPAAPVLVLPDCHAAAAAELAAMRPGPRAANVLRLVGSVLRYLQQREDATGPAAAAFQEAYPPLAVARLAAAARQLSAFAGTRWPALAALLAPAVVADGWPPARAGIEAAAVAPAAAPVAESPALAATPPPPAAPAEDSPRKPAASGKLSPGGSGSGGKLSPGGSGSGGKLARLSAETAVPGTDPEMLPELAEQDGLRRVMHPAVLGAATLAVAGAVLGVGWAFSCRSLG